jgi:hypothetical protein
VASYDGPLVGLMDQIEQAVDGVWIPHGTGWLLIPATQRDKLTANGPQTPVIDPTQVIRSLTAEQTALLATGGMIRAVDLSLTQREMLRRACIAKFLRSPEQYPLAFIDVDQAYLSTTVDAVSRKTIAVTLVGTQALANRETCAAPFASVPVELRGGRLWLRKSGLK